MNFPGAPIDLAMRDIARACKWIRLHPNASSVLLHYPAGGMAGARVAISPLDSLYFYLISMDLRASSAEKWMQYKTHIS